MECVKAISVTMLAACMAGAQVDTNSQKFYLFTYFLTSEQAGGARLALSSDGITWERYNNGKPVVVPTVGSEKIMRDPMIVFDPATRTFHMTFTTGWGGKDIGIAESKDLTTWTNQKAVRVGDSIPGCTACWAPECFYDDLQGKFMIVWSTNTSGSTMAGENLFRAYYCMTSDFNTFTKPKKLFDPGHTGIDFTLLKMATGSYYLFMKDEPTDAILYVSGPTPQGPWSALSTPMSETGIEGPTVIKIGSEVRVYFDPYATDPTYRMVKSGLPLSTGSPWPDGGRVMCGGTDFTYSHGNIIEIPREYVMLLKYNRPLPSTSTTMPVAKASPGAAIGLHKRKSQEFDVSGKVVPKEDARPRHGCALVRAASTWP